MKQQDIGHAMTGNVQGFELPRGCLMTTGLILAPVVVLGIALFILW